MKAQRTTTGQTDKGSTALEPDRFPAQTELLQSQVEKFILSCEEDPSKVNELGSQLIEELMTAMEELSTAEEELVAQLEEVQSAQSSLEAERQRYHELFDFAPDGFLVTDLYGKVLEANQAALSLLKIPSTRLRPIFLTQFVPEAERKNFRSQLNRFRKQASQADLEYGSSLILIRDWMILVQPPGHPAFHATFSAALGRWSGEPILRWAIHDVTERRLAEKSAEEREAWFRTLAETSQVAIFLTLDGKIQYANPAASKLTLYPIEHLQQMPILQLIHPEDRPAFQAIEDPSFQPDLDEAYSSDSGPSLRKDVQFLTQNQEVRWADFSAGYLDMHEQRVWIVTAYDITQRIQSEQARKSLLRELVRAQEEERLRISQELHDQMGQNLTALTLSLKWVEESIQNQTQQDQYTKIQAMIDQIGQEIHRVAYELRPASLDDFGLNVVLANYAEEWSKQHNIPVDFQVSYWYEQLIPPAVSIVMYRVVQEAFTNILRHAQASRVSLVVESHPGWLRAILEDNGIGFDFVQVMGNPQKRHLGLLGMRERVDQTGGTLLVETSPGSGTTIYVLIPIERQERSGQVA